MSISLYQELLCILFMIKYYSRLGNADNAVAHTVGSVHFDPFNASISNGMLPFAVYRFFAQCSAAMSPWNY